MPIQFPPSRIPPPGGIADVAQPPPISGMNPYLDSLMNRWNEVMDLQLRRMEPLPQRDAIAFREWTRGKDMALTTEADANDRAQRSEAAARAERERLIKQEAADRARADFDRRAAMNDEQLRVAGQGYNAVPDSMRTGAPVDLLTEEAQRWVWPPPRSSPSRLKP